MHGGAQILLSTPSSLSLSFSFFQLHELLFTLVGNMAIVKTIQGLNPQAKQASVRNLELEHLFSVKASTETSLYTINDLLVQKARFSPDVPLLAYPASPNGRDDYVHYTARDLDRFVDEAVRIYVAMGLPVKVRSFYQFYYTSVSLPMLIINLFR
jgi:hypothetical protein